MFMGSELTCSICLEIYTDPLQLSCLHSYCRQCLKDIQAKTQREQQTFEAVWGRNRPSSFKCPDCRKNTRLKNGVDGLPRNFTLDNIAAKFKQNLQAQRVTTVILCSLCETNPKPAVKTCPSCSGNNYCEECLQQCHPRRGAFKNHVLCEPREVNSNSRKGNSDAADGKTVFCSTCSCVISQDAQLAHVHHTIQTLDKAVQSQKTQLQALLQELLDMQEAEKENLQTNSDYNQRRMADFNRYKDAAQRYISEVDDIVQTADGFKTDHLDSKSMIAYLKGVADIKSQIKRLKMPGSVQIDQMSITSFQEDFAVHTGKTPKTDSPPVKPNAFLDILEVKSIPSNHDTACVRLSWWSNCTDLTYKVTCRHTRTQEGSKVVEEVCVDTITCSVEVQWLRPSASYRAVITGSDAQGRTITDEIEFTTESSINSAAFCWHESLHHPSVAVSGSGDLVVHEIHKEDIDVGWCETQGSLHRVEGCCSSVSFDSGSRYWDVLVKYQVLRHIDNSDLILNLGICLDKGKDSFSPLSENYYSLCCTLLKLPDMPMVAMDFWDGRDRRTVFEGIPIGSLGRRAVTSVTLGFFLDFPNNTFKIIDVEKNKILMVFGDVHCNDYVAECEFYNEDKIRVSVELFPDGDVSLPKCLFD